jgi:hypothetical protein
VPRAVLIVFTQPASPEQEDEYNEWYDNVHLADVTTLIPGIVAARRYRSSDLMRLPGDYGDFDYMAIYEIDTEDLEETVAALKNARPSGLMVVADVFHETLTGRNGLFVLRD